MTLDALRDDCARAQRKGLHFILASIPIWGAILAVMLTRLPLGQKNLLVFCCTTPLMPLALLFSRFLKIDFTHKSNPLTRLGLLFSLNQIFYLLIPMWAMNAAPRQMLMLLALIFGAHLFPFSWLYRSRAYLMAALILTPATLALNLIWGPTVLAGFMVVLTYYALKDRR